MGVFARASAIGGARRVQMNRVYVFVIHLLAAESIHEFYFCWNLYFPFHLSIAVDGDAAKGATPTEASE